ncbi:MAG: hypothetical protein ACKVKG_09665 [Alphaproteobacteria bacterium]|jgi:hypothetical protein
MKLDLSDRVLTQLLAIAVVVLVFYSLAYPGLATAWRTQGSPQLYLTAVAGASLLMVSVLFLLAKRGGRGSPRLWFIAHVIAALAGFVLVVIHAAGAFLEPPALLLLALIGLMGLGVWARMSLSKRMASTFATKRGGFTPLDEKATARLRDLIAEKEAVLAKLDPTASEALFSVTLAHWFKRPGLAWAYHKLAQTEQRLIGARQSVGAAQAWWRPIHMALAGLFITGLLSHIVIVTFFAGYVAEGRAIYWWHITAW